MSSIPVWRRRRAPESERTPAWIWVVAVTALAIGLSLIALFVLSLYAIGRGS